MLPAVQLDPHSALREARRLMTVYRDYVPPQHAELAILHVWARRLALALEGDLPDEALARFAVLWSSPLSHRYLWIVAVLWLCCGQYEVAASRWRKSDFL